MVYRQFSKAKDSAEEEDQEASSPLMATSTAPAPVKSQPLHNFSLPHLKWGKNQTSNQRCRKPSESRDSHQNRRSYSANSEAESDDGGSSSLLQDQDTVNQKTSFGSRALAKNRNSNLVLKISKTAGKSSGTGNGDEEGELEERMMRNQNQWNLRPRRTVGKMTINDNGKGGSKNGGGEFEEASIQPKSLRLRGLVEPEKNVEKKVKIKFSIPLERDEIEEDFFAWTGSKPPRRPKKRNKTIQKQLDNAFPGLWLAGITADCYNVPELTSKHK